MDENVIKYGLDCILLLLFVLPVLSGLKRGLIVMIISAVAAIAAFLVARIFAPDIGRWLYDSFARERIISAVSDEIAKTVPEGAGQISAALPQPVIAIAGFFGVDPGEIFPGLTLTGESAGEIASRAVSALAEPLIIPAFGFISFAVSGTLIYVLLNIALIPVKELVKLPVLKQANKAAGAALGAVKGVFYVIIVATAAVIIACAFPDTPAGQAVGYSKIVGLIPSVI
jgi:uncharacterized membrane protein required for colicin V production